MPTDDPPLPEPPLSDAQQARYDALRAWRRALAATLALRPFMILPNATLLELIRAHPTTSEALLAVKGIGPAKAAAYGADLLAWLRAPEGGALPVRVTEQALLARLAGVLATAGFAVARATPAPEPPEAGALPDLVARRADDGLTLVVSAFVSEGEAPAAPGAPP